MQTAYDGWPYTLAAALVLVLSVVASARTWYVPSECPTIKAGLDSASGGDTVLVAPGTYMTDEDPETRIRPGAGDRLLSQGGPDATVIEMCNTSTGIVLASGAEGVRVEGFTIRFGSGPDCDPPMGPTCGIECWDVTDAVVEGCVIEGLNVGIKIEGTSLEWHKPVFKNTVIRACGYGVACHDMNDPGRPFLKGNLVTGCCCGVEVVNSSPILEGNEIAYCRDYGMLYVGHCGGGCIANKVIHNEGIGVCMFNDPLLAVPILNGTGKLEGANDVYGNGTWEIWCENAGPVDLVMAVYNYWGSDCPCFTSEVHGSVDYSPWVDSTHSVILSESNCPDAVLPTTWGSIKAMYR
jgi:hypothetical protein